MARAAREIAHEVGPGRLNPRGRRPLPGRIVGRHAKTRGLALAIAGDPEIVLLDEPTTGLDPIMADVINDLIVKCVAELGASAVSITHDMASARKIANRVAMLYEGRIIWHGPIDDIDASGNPYVDQFIHGRAEGPLPCPLHGAELHRMAKRTSQYICQACGAVSAKWAGKCEACDEWNSMVEEVVESAAPKGITSRGGRRVDLVGLAGQDTPPARRVSGLAEIDRVLGGGLVPGSAVLIGGDPGIGKSTLLLQVVARLSKGGGCAYISGEEAVDQVRMRAARLGVSAAPVALAASTNVRDILATLDAPDGPSVVVIDRSRPCGRIGPPPARWHRSALRLRN